MNRTHPSTLIGLGLAGAVVCFLLESASAASGHAVFVPPLTLAFTLAIIAAAVVALALPIRQAVHGRVRRRIDPFRAMRVAALAKACALAAALLLGGGIGVLVYLLSRTAVASTGPILLTITSSVAAVVLLIAGLVAEFFCTLPPDDDDEGHVHA